jgi:CheY-like chemotaxis protein
MDEIPDIDPVSGRLKLSQLTHDLRNALGAVKNAAQILRLKPQDADSVRRATAIIDKQVAYMVALLDAVPGVPAEPPPSAPAQPIVDATQRAAGPLRLLLVDDSADVRDTFAEILEEAGYQVRTVGEGNAALAEADAWQPHVVMLDIHIPGRNGYEVAAELRERFDAAVPKLVMFSGMQLDEVTLRESMRRGFDFCFDKTGDFAELDGWLQRNLKPVLADAAQP